MSDLKRVIELNTNGLFVRQVDTLGHEVTIDRVVEQIRHIGRVDVGKASQMSREVRRIRVCAKHAAKVGVERALGCLLERLAFPQPALSQLDRVISATVGLVQKHGLLDETLESGEPGSVALKLDTIERAHLVLELVDDGARAPPMLEERLRQVAVDVVAKVEHVVALPAGQLEHLEQVALVVDLVGAELAHALPRLRVGLHIELAKLFGLGGEKVRLARIAYDQVEVVRPVGAEQ